MAEKPKNDTPEVLKDDALDNVQGGALPMSPTSFDAHTAINTNQAGRSLNTDQSALSLNTNQAGRSINTHQAGVKLNTDQAG